MPSSQHEVDELDAQIILELRRSPRLGIMELARRLGVARGTATARLEKMTAAGVITGFGPDLDLSRLGYPVMAFVTVEVTQGHIDAVTERLRAIPEVLEAHTTAGQGDLMLRVVARSNAHLFEVLEGALQSPEIRRTSTAIALMEHIPFRTDRLMERVADSP